MQRGHQGPCGVDQGAVPDNQPARDSTCRQPLGGPHGRRHTGARPLGTVAAKSIYVCGEVLHDCFQSSPSLVNTINALKQKLNPALEISGIVRTMYDVRNNLASAVSNELTQHFGDKVFRSIVPRNVRLAEAPSHGRSIIGYDRASRGGIAYLGLAGEIVRGEKKLAKEAAR